MAREYTAPAQVFTEEFRTIEEITGLLVRVMVGSVDKDGRFVVPQQFSVYEIKDEDFAELMSASPSWAANKPANTYRNEDLWIFVDRIRAKEVYL